MSTEAWLSTLQAMLPPGRALSREPGSNLTALLMGIAARLAAAQKRFEDLVQEWEPRRATMMLPDWERLLGLPDPCLPTSGLETPERQRIAYQRLTEQGGQSRQFFIDLAAQYGEPGVTITEFRRATCNSNCNARLYSQADEFVWRVDIPRGIFDGRAANCNSNCNSRLFVYALSQAECPITERKPAHTHVLFAYTGPTAIGYNYTIGADPIFA